jgi:hypothetical protein
MELRRVLLVNDDTDDSLLIQKRLPRELSVTIVTQWQARSLNDYNYDLIVVDNDANNLEAAKGPETLEKIKEKGVQARVVFTSFQPGAVDSRIYQIVGVTVIRTDKLLAFLREEFNLKLRRSAKKDATRPKTTIMVTYNTIDGYAEGVYGQGRLIILSYNKDAGDRAREIVREKLIKIYETFKWQSDREFIKNIFVYDGLSGGRWPGYMASALGHDIRMKVQLLACKCEWSRKVELAGLVDLHKVECGGQAEMGIIADMGVRRPDMNYDEVSVPLSVIENGAEKFKI